MTAELVGDLERRGALRRTLGTLTIGQAPRSDIAPILRQHVPAGVEVVDSGLLDGLSGDEIRSRYGAEDGKPVLLTRLRDGGSVQLSSRKVQDGIQAKLSALEACGCDVILVLCTGQFHGLSCARAWLLEPDRIIPPAVAGLVQDRQLGVIVPLLSQMDSESGKWTVLPRMPIFVAASPYDDPPETLEATVKIRYNHPGTAATVTPVGGGKAKVKLHAPQRAITPGQAAVFYQEDLVVGGGWIERQSAF